MLGKGIAVGKNIDLNKIMGKKYFNRKSFPYGKESTSILAGWVKLLENMKVSSQMEKK